MSKPVTGFPVVELYVRDNVPCGIVIPVSLPTTTHRKAFGSIDAVDALAVDGSSFAPKKGVQAAVTETRALGGELAQAPRQLCRIAATMPVEAGRSPQARQNTVSNAQTPSGRVGVRTAESGHVDRGVGFGEFRAWRSSRIALRAPAGER